MNQIIWLLHDQPFGKTLEPSSDNLQSDPKQVTSCAPPEMCFSF